MPSLAGDVRWVSPPGWAARRDHCGPPAAAGWGRRSGCQAQAVACATLLVERVRDCAIGDRSDPRATVAGWEYRSSGGHDRGHNRPSGGYDRGHSRQVFRCSYAHAWGKRLTCPELKYKCCGELWYATRARAAGHLRRGAIVGSQAAILFDRDPFLDLVVYACPPWWRNLPWLHSPPGESDMPTQWLHARLCYHEFLGPRGSGHDHHAPSRKEMYR